MENDVLFPDLENNNLESTREWIKEQTLRYGDMLSKIDNNVKFTELIEEFYSYSRFSTPQYKGGNLFFLQQADKEDQPSIMMKSGNGDIIKLIDITSLSSDHNLSLANFSVSNNGDFMTLNLQVNGSDWSDIRIFNIKEKKFLSNKISWVKFTTPVWNDNGFYYCSFKNGNEESKLTDITDTQSVYHHVIGNHESQDQLIYSSKSGEQCYLNPYVDKKNNVYINIAKGTSGEDILYKNGKGEFTSLYNNFNGDVKIVGEVDGFLYLLTNRGADNFHIVRCDLITGFSEIIIPQSDNYPIQDCIVSHTFIVCNIIKECRSVLEVYNISGEYLYEIVPASPSTITTISLEDDKLFYDKCSFDHPYEIYSFDLSSKINKVELTCDVNIDINIDYKMAIADDNQNIPMFILSEKNSVFPNNIPTHLYGYGGFNISLTPSFSPANLAWVLCGGVFSQAILRGGGEFGEKWHRQGMLLNKKRVFKDFICCANYLIDNGYTKSDNLTISGGSNGGLLVGAVINYRPDLFKSAIIRVGVLDMLRYHLFTVGWGWIPEYGDPSEDNMYAYIKSYSPLHNVKRGIKYPKTLIMCGDHDDRVVPSHSYKFAAQLLNNVSNPEDIYLRVDHNTGHGAGKPISKIIEEQVAIYNFAMADCKADTLKFMF